MILNKLFDLSNLFLKMYDVVYNSCYLTGVLWKSNNIIYVNLLISCLVHTKSSIKVIYYCCWHKCFHLITTTKTILQCDIILSLHLMRLALKKQQKETYLRHTGISLFAKPMLLTSMTNSLLGRNAVISRVHKRFSSPTGKQWSYPSIGRE